MRLRLTGIGVLGLALAVLLVRSVTLRSAHPRPNRPVAELPVNPPEQFPASVSPPTTRAIAPATLRGIPERAFSWDPARSLREQLLEELQITRIDGARLGFRAALCQRSEDVGGALVEILQDQTLPDQPRCGAARTLAEFDGRGSREALREALKNPTLREAAIFAVQRRGDSSFAEPLLKLFEAGTDYRIVETLGHLGNREALPLLDRLLLLRPEDILKEMILKEYPPELLEHAPDVWEQRKLDIERARAQILIASGPNPESGAIPCLYGADPRMAGWSVALLARLNPPDLCVHLRGALNHRKSSWSRSKRSIWLEDEVLLMTSLRDRGGPLTPAESDWLQNWDNGQFSQLPQE